MYLPTAIQIGILPLSCWLFFYLQHFWDSLCIIYYRTNFDNTEVVCSFADMIETFDYMIAGSANDSAIAVAPVYWALLGIGIRINAHQKEHMKPDKKLITEICQKAFTMCQQKLFCTYIPNKIISIPVSLIARYANSIITDEKTRIKAVGSVGKCRFLLIETYADYMLQYK